MYGGFADAEHGCGAPHRAFFLYQIPRQHARPLFPINEHDDNSPAFRNRHEHGSVFCYIYMGSMRGKCI
jgi:hypothetical protein